MKFDFSEGLRSLMNSPDIKELLKNPIMSLDEVEVEGNAGAGMVNVSFTGLKCTDIVIDETIIDKSNKNMIEDLVVAAVNDAISKAQNAVKEKVTSQFGAKFAGFDINNP